MPNDPGILNVDQLPEHYDRATLARILEAMMSRLADEFARTHAPTHENGGNDPIGTETPAAHAIPKADEDGRLNDWVDIPAIPPGSGEANTISSLGGVTLIGTPSKVGVDLKTKGLVAGTNITLTPAANSVTIDATGGGADATTASNLGAGAGVFASEVGDDLRFKSLTAGANVTLTPSGTEIQIAAAGAPADATTASNLGAGAGVFASEVGDDLRFKSLTAGSNVTLTPSGTEIQIASAPGVHTHVAADITDFTEAAQDVIGAALVDGTTIDFTYDDAGNTITAERKALTGDVTAPLASNATTIAADAVTFSKMQNIATDKLVGRDTAGTGDPEALDVSGGLEFTGAAGIRRSALTGDVTASAGSNATTIANDAVTYAKMQNVSATDKVLGRSTAGAGDVEEIPCTAAGRALIGGADAAAQKLTLGVNDLNFGDGSDGSKTISGPYSQTSDEYRTAVTIQSGGTWSCNGYRLWSDTQIDVQTGGILQDSSAAKNGLPGGTGVGDGVGGMAQIQNFLGTAGDGGSGKAVTAGTAGTDPLRACGGAGGNGGAGSVTAGGAGGAVTVPTANNGGLRGITVPPQCWNHLIQGSANRFNGGAGGGGGGGDGVANKGGGGGAAGAPMLVIARKIIGAGTIRSNGGVGGAGTVSGAGGGGGGGGGTVCLITAEDVTAPTIQANGGAGGAAGSGASAGVAGSAGNIFKMIV